MNKFGHFCGIWAAKIEFGHICGIWAGNALKFGLQHIQFRDILKYTLNLFLIT